MRKTRTFLTILIFGILMNACAFDLAHIKQVPANLTTQSSIGSWKLVDEVHVSIGNGYSRKLNNETKWNYVGSIEAGDVYKTNDQILTIEASNIYEAYIVISEYNLIGFYLPVEKTFSPLSSPITLQIERINL